MNRPKSNRKKKILKPDNTRKISHLIVFRCTGFKKKGICYIYEIILGSCQLNFAQTAIHTENWRNGRWLLFYNYFLMQTTSSPALLHQAVTLGWILLFWWQQMQWRGKAELLNTMCRGWLQGLVSNLQAPRWLSKLSNRNEKRKDNMIGRDSAAKTKTSLLYLDKESRWCNSGFERGNRRAGFKFRSCS